MKQEATPLRRLRDERGMTQRALAEATGICQQTICAYEQRPDLSRAAHRNLAALADALGVDVADLLPKT